MSNKVTIDRFPYPAIEIELTDEDWQRYINGDIVDLDPYIRDAEARIADDKG